MNSLKWREPILQAKIETLSIEQLEDLGEELLDFAEVSDLWRGWDIRNCNRISPPNCGKVSVRSALALRRNL